MFPSHLWVFHYIIVFIADGLFLCAQVCLFAKKIVFSFKSAWNKITVRVSQLLNVQTLLVGMFFMHKLTRIIVISDGILSSFLLLPTSAKRWGHYQ